MTQKDKELLLIELCARLPFKIKVKVSEVSYPVEFDVQMLSEIKNNNWYEYPIPYLRPMSSMTDEEQKELGNYVASIMFASQNKNPLFQLTREALIGDFFNKHHIDYRGLIPMGLALEEPKNMY